MVTAKDSVVRVWIVLVCCAGALAAPAGYDVRDYGAKADGQTLCTASIQRAIDACAAAGGGTVRLGPGTFLSGTLVLKSNVTLDLDPACTLRGSTRLADYPTMRPAFRSYTDNYTERSLIYAEKLDRPAITGRGTIDGQGAAFEGPYKVRPYLIRMIECTNVTVLDVTIVNSPMWVQHYLACDDVRIRGVTVKSHVNHNNDGIDIDSCRRVVITGCNIDSGDDAIVLKSTSARPCKDVVVTGCVLRSTCNALKMGTESNGGFENIVLTGCTIYDTRLAGVALEIVDGGTMDGVVVSDMTMRGVGAPIFIRLGHRARPFKDGMAPPGVGALRNVTIAHIEATGAGATGCAIAGLGEAAIENVTLSDIRLSFAGGGTGAEAGRSIPEEPAKYPEYSMFGRLPAYGLYCRHVEGLRLTNVALQAATADARHAIVLDDAADVAIDAVEAGFSPGAEAVLSLRDVRGAWIRGCRPQARGGTFAQIRGARTAAVTLAGNDLASVATVVDTSAEVRDAAVVCMDNRLE